MLEQSVLQPSLRRDGLPSDGTISSGILQKQNLGARGEGAELDRCGPGSVHRRMFRSLQQRASNPLVLSAAQNTCCLTQ